MMLGLCCSCECGALIGGQLDQRSTTDGASEAGARDLPAAPSDGPGPDLRRPDAKPTICSGSHAYLHGDLWPMWYNMRMCCDGEHRAIWRCERINGVGSSTCNALRAHYQGCLADPNAEVCPNWGVCCFKGSNGCTDPTPEYLKICDTRSIDYASPTIWGTYYGRQWGSGTTLHRFLTLQVWDSAGTRIASFSSNPGEADAYVEGVQNHGVGAQPQGFTQVIVDKLRDRFGSFACIRLPTGQPLTLQAIWMNDFCHTCKSSYWSQPDTACRSAKLTLTPEPGRHYLWTERGLEKMSGCGGPPPEVAKWLPAAACSTSN
jgi:hypothetical protein